MAASDCPLHQDPFQQFELWFDEARRNEAQAEAMTLATASRQAVPSARMVLYKGIDQGGFLIFTNLQSRKAKEMLENPLAALVCHWPCCRRQVRMEGRVEKISQKEADRYFQIRPRDSQIGALASHQSQVIANREVLEKKFDEISREYEGKVIPCPSFWGGFRLIPASFEFWNERPSRLHDRFLYTRDISGWKIERLAP